MSFRDLSLSIHRSLCSGWWKLRGLLALWEPWKLFSYSSLEILCPPLWGFTLYIYSFEFSKKIQELPMQIPGALSLPTFFLSGTLLYWCQSYDCSFLNESTTLCVASSFCSVVQNVPPGREFGWLVGITSFVSDSISAGSWSCAVYSLMYENNIEGLPWWLRR